MKKELSFEDKMLRLQAISLELDSKSTELATSVKLYQEAQTLLKSAKLELVKAKHIVENSLTAEQMQSDEYLQTLKDDD